MSGLAGRRSINDEYGVDVMSLLKAEPAGTVRSLDELFVLAYAMEQEAATRYAELAIEMRRQGDQSLVGVFEQLASAERGHVESVTRWSESRVGRRPDPSMIRWEGPETFDAETAAEITTSRLMTPYRALSMAVRNEERAFAFWSYVAARAEEDEIKQAAETMAREELGHVAILRKERRRAYHSERSGKRLLAHGVASGEIDAGPLEARLADRLDELAQHLNRPSADRTRELSREARRMSEEARGFGRFPADAERHDAQTIAEMLADAYLEGADASGDPEDLDRLQKLAERSIARLAWLRALG